MAVPPNPDYLHVAARAPLAIKFDRDVGPQVRPIGLGSPKAPKVGRTPTLEELVFNYRLWRLSREHRELEDQLRAELRRKQPSDAIIRSLKRRKLRVRDEMFLAETGLAPVRNVAR